MLTTIDERTKKINQLSPIKRWNGWGWCEVKINYNYMLSTIEHSSKATLRHFSWFLRPHYLWHARHCFVVGGNEGKLMSRRQFSIVKCGRSELMRTEAIWLFQLNPSISLPPRMACTSILLEVISLGNLDASLVVDHTRGM